MSPAVIDLGYAGPTPPPDLADRARRGGRRLRRRRRTGAAALVLTVVAGVGFAVRGPSTEPVVPVVPLPPEQRKPVVTVTAAGGFTASVFLSADRTRLCYGPRVTDGGQDGRTGCMPRSDRRLTGTARFGSRGVDSFDADRDAFHDAGEPTYLLVYGQVHGEVTRVTVADLGDTVDATLARSADPAVGTLYAAVIGPVTQPPTDSPVLVAYRGDGTADTCGTNGRCTDDARPRTDRVVPGVPATGSP